VSLFRAGSFGVVLFFVLSGFLITTVLLRELDRSAAVRLGGFYFRRAKRLIPALLVVVLAHLLLQLTVLGEPEHWWERTWPVLAYVSNFTVAGGQDLVHMSHTWSLAIEEHFYLVWPVLLMLTPRRFRFRLAATLAGSFAVWRVVLLAAGADNLRVFFSTDTNAFAPLLGCALAIAYHEGRLPTPSANMSALATAALLAAASIPLDFTDRRLLWGSIPFAALAAVAIYAAIDRPATWLENRVLRWFGMISYGLYLWHFMLISLPWERLPMPPMVGMVGAPIAMAWLSWRFVEAPILRHKVVQPDALVAPGSAEITAPTVPA
jgi:peptidoglycan/LPS O-acetylase OafA/YrhL